MTDCFSLRWKQQVPEGYYAWYLRKIEPDGSYWGYIHRRTKELNSNQNISGKIKVELYDLVIKSVDFIKSKNSQRIQSDFFDIAIFSSDGTAIWQCNRVDFVSCENSRRLIELSTAIQNAVTDDFSSS